MRAINGVVNGVNRTSTKKKISPFNFLTSQTGTSFEFGRTLECPSGFQTFTYIIYNFEK